MDSLYERMIIDSYLVNFYINTDLDLDIESNLNLSNFIIFQAYK